MAGSKEATDRPSYHAVGKEDIVAVDRKTFRSDVWEHWHLCSFPPPPPLYYSIYGIITFTVS